LKVKLVSSSQPSKELAEQGIINAQELVAYCASINITMKTLREYIDLVTESQNNISEKVMPGIKKGGALNTWNRDGDIDLRAFIPGRGRFNIEAYTKEGEKIGYIIFSVNQNALTADKVFVDPQYRRQKVATKMYDFAQSLENDIIPSDSLMPDGQAFWQNRQSSQW